MTVTEQMPTAAAQQPVAAEQPPADRVQQPAAPSRKTAIPKYNFRVMTNFDDCQARNIQTLTKRMGGNDSLTVRAAIDAFSYLNGLPTESDPSIYLTAFLARANLNGE